jgi:hypothetical protein
MDIQDCPPNYKLVYKPQKNYFVISVISTIKHRIIELSHSLLATVHAILRGPILYPSYPVWTPSTPATGPTPLPSRREPREPALSIRRRVKYADEFQCVHLYLYIYIYLYLYLNLYLSIYLSFFLSTYASIYLTTVSVSLSI